MSFNHLPATWHIKTLGEIAKRPYGLVDGPFGSNLKSSEYTNDGVPVIRGSNLSLGGKKFNDSEFVFVSQGKAQQLERSICYPNDIIFTKKGTLGQTGLVPQNHRFEKFLLSSNQMKLSVDKAIADPVFVYYFVSSPTSQAKIIRDSEATGVPKTNLAYLRTFPILLPPLNEQKAIAAALSAFDDKIELNRQMNATLEEMARALFKSWFVDFDPVRRNQAGGPSQPYDHLFPDEMVESEGGRGREIPSGWRKEPIGSHITATKGLSYKGEFLADEGTPMHNLNSVYEGGGYKYEGLKLYSGDYQERHIVKPGDVIVTNTEQGFDRLLLGYPAIIPRIFGDWGIFSHHIFRVRAKPESPISNIFIYFLLRNRMYHDLISGFGNGTTVNMLPSDALEKPEILIPSQQVIECFDSIARPILAKYEANYLNLVQISDSSITGEKRGKGRDKRSRQFMRLIE